MESILAASTGTVVGLMVGVECAVALIMNRILLGLPSEAALFASRAGVAKRMGQVMPLWYIGSLLLIVALAVTTWGTTTSAGALIAAGLMIVSVILSVTVLVPINNRSINWTAENHPDDWREQFRRWDRFHYLRVAIVVAAFAVIEVALTQL